MLSKIPSLFITIALALVLAILKVTYSFFPLFNLTDVAIFFLAGMLMKRHRVAYSYVTVIPALFVSLFFVFSLGADKLLRGEGTGWLVSTLLIPIAFYLGTKFSPSPRSRKE